MSTSFALNWRAQACYRAARRKSINTGNNREAPARRTRQAALAIFPGALGDLICAAPAIAALVRRHGNLDVAAAAPLEWLAGALAGAGLAPSLDDSRWAGLFEPGGGKRALEWLGRRPAVYSWLGSANSRFQAALAAISQSPPQFNRVIREEGRVHVSREYLAQVGVGRCGSLVRSPLRLARRPEPDRSGARWWPDDLAAPRLLVHPGSGSMSKRWDPAGFVEVLNRWKTEVKGSAVLLLGPAERGEAEEWSVPSVVPVRDLSLEQAARLIAGADLFVGNDSGMSHLAGAVGARGVVIFGPTDPRRWAPLGGHLVAVARLDLLSGGRVPKAVMAAGPGPVEARRLSVSDGGPPAERSRRPWSSRGRCGVSLAEIPVSLVISTLEGLRVNRRNPAGRGPGAPP